MRPKEGKAGWRGSTWQSLRQKMRGKRGEKVPTMVPNTIQLAEMDDVINVSLNFCSDRQLIQLYFRILDHGLVTCIVFSNPSGHKYIYRHTQ